MCPGWFDATQFVWKHPLGTCSSGAAFYLNFIHGICMSLLILSINTVTFISLWKRMRKNGPMSEQQTSMLRKNKKLYLQGCIGSAIIILAVTSVQVLSSLAKTRVQVFIATTLTMEMAHISDSIVLIAFNKHLRGRLFQPHLFIKKILTSF
ncbi:hypothetical protein Y032_0012g1824 [Ancylostoma ceylanicum]|uniref:7TM GPCR serpentine receptor class x (Srx) domain-containing protein n=1 Tax=Ancylostoma ceylanicum TaxID=53326 RepID=A0A016VD14_9BILA|nr:hypothetical protein Y032_0012g1824 [Ancylostoma ceylanicum]